MNEGEHRQLVVECLLADGRFPTARTIVPVDGLRVEYVDGFDLVRVSNTTPVYVLRFEGDDEPALRRIEAAFRAVIEAVWPGLSWGSNDGDH